VYELKHPAVLVRVVGRSFLGAKVIERQQLRCNLCLKVFTAKMPEGVGPEKYDETAASMIAILRYGTGLPFNRLKGLQKNFGIPLPAATQWDIVERLSKLVAPAYTQLIREAAQGDVLHNDDTPMKVLQLMEENKKRKERKGDG
jgi:transposase